MKRKIEDVYQKKTQLDHILSRPCMYIGSIEKTNIYECVLNNDNTKIIYDNVNIVYGLYKIFDEILVNAFDNYQRSNKMNRLEVKIDNDIISIYNNGLCIPITIHNEHNVYIPEMIFGHLLTSSNYDDDIKRTTGGLNGYGAKLTNIFSTYFMVEIGDCDSKQQYKQEWFDNMSRCSIPKIKSYSGKNYTRITFKPDFNRFGMSNGFQDNDTIKLIRRRVYDIAGCTHKSLRVKLNGYKIPIHSFKQYMEMYIDSNEKKYAYIRLNDRCEVCVTSSYNGHRQNVSFVNGIYTTNGTHINHISNQISKTISSKLSKKNVNIKPTHVSNQLFIFVNSLVENPTFDSQTKTTLTTRVDKFGFSCELPMNFINKISKCGVADNIASLTMVKQVKELKKSDGNKKSRITDILKLEDANLAGTKRSNECTLILTEGDSAKTLAMSGLSIVGKNKYGVFPLKGKLLNVRSATHNTIMNNTEITSIKKIMGLQIGKTYDTLKDMKSLRYGHLMIMADQDTDGSHIKGLIVNFIHNYWPSLVKRRGFLLEFITPIVKCTGSKHQQISFFTLPEYELWKSNNDNGKNWHIKYYKGLGTSTAIEAKQYFTNINKHLIPFKYNDSLDDDAIELAFSSSKRARSADKRKEWLSQINDDVFIDYNVKSISYSDFVHKELILFSMDDNIRSIPSICDGFKPSQRKILYSCFKRNLNNEIKVAQLTGYVSEVSSYHHGEMSLSSTIIGMAQNFVGSNNINLLNPNGQFGTRLQGGNDSASARYIFTSLNSLTRSIFHIDDDQILTYLNDDGMSIEPKYYIPIIPMILINGCDGIGTGWSTSIPCYNPRDIITNIKRLLCNEEPINMHPWYKDFNGTIEDKQSGLNGYVVSGCYKWLNDTQLTITELPIRVWSQTYKQFLEKLVNDNKIKDYTSQCTDTIVSFTVTFNSIDDANKAKQDVMAFFKLTSTISTSNMVLFGCNGKLKKYDSPIEIIREFFDFRLSFYVKRKEFLVDKYTNELSILDSKIKFILEVINNTLIISNKSKCDIVNELKQRIYPMVCNSFDYLLNMSIISLTKEKIDILQNEACKKRTLLDSIISQPVKDMWIADLDCLLENI